MADLWSVSVSLLPTAIPRSAGLHFLGILCEFPGAASNRPSQALGLQTTDIYFIIFLETTKSMCPAHFLKPRGVRVEVGAMTFPATPASE